MERKDFAYSIGIFAASLIVYYATLSPGIYAGDSGDFITAAYTLGIPHPAGFPIYTILGKIFTLIPYGNVAFRINLMNAIFTALTAAVLYHTVVLLTKSRFSGAGASLMLAFSYTLWNQNALGKSYCLNALVFSVLVYLAVLWIKTKQEKCLYYLAFIYGLSLTNHISIAVLLPAFIYLAWRTNKKSLKMETVRNAILLSVAGLCFYLYLPIRARMKPEHNWGDPETLERFLIHVTAYVHRRTHTFVLDAAGSTSRFFELLWLYAKQFSVSGVMVLIGLFSMEKNAFMRFSVLVVLLDSFYTMFLNVVSFQNTAFGAPSYVIFGVWAGYGIKNVLQKIEKRIKDSKTRAYACVAFVALLAVIPLAANYGLNDQSSNRIAYYYGMDLLKTVENSSVIFAEGDNEVLILRYLLVVEKARPDVAMYDMNGFLSTDFYGVDYPWLPEEEHNERQDKVEYEMIKSGRPVYYTSKRNMNNMPGYNIEQAGLLYHVMEQNISLPKKDYWKEYDTTGFDNEGINKDYMTRAIIATYHTRRGSSYFNDGYVDKALAEYEKASSIGADIPDIHGNLCKMYLERKLYN
ncbi:MAG: DUF2723 domain-containing protein, partial [Candidatus Altiarchaeota archaeon]|nr:DUF2723 domain-containing protein [Candidatus Altiarchaeota archaeon]